MILNQPFQLIIYPHKTFQVIQHQGQAGDKDHFKFVTKKEFNDRMKRKIISTNDKEDKDEIANNVEELTEIWEFIAQVWCYSKLFI